MRFMRSSFRRAGMLPLALAVTTGLLLMQVSTSCLPENLLTTPADENAQTLPDSLESGRVLTDEELQQLIANANDQDIVVVFTNPVPGPQGPAGADAPVGAGLVGEVRMWAGHPAHPPAGWLVCDGAAISRIRYDELFSVIGVNFGVGDEVATFNLPDFHNRSPMGADTWNANGQALTSVSGSAVRQGGAATHTLAEAELPNHRHNMSHTHEIDVSTDLTFGAHDYVQAGIDNGGTVGMFETTGSSSLNTSPTGSNSPHNNLHPYFAITYIIYTGESSDGV